MSYFDCAALLGELDQNNTTLFIGALSSSVTEEDLRSFFGRFGDIVYTKIPAGKGCGFVQYVNRASAELAMQQMQGQVGSESNKHLSVVGKALICGGERRICDGGRRRTIGFERHDEESLRGVKSTAADRELLDPLLRILEYNNVCSCWFCLLGQTLLQLDRRQRCLGPDKFLLSLADYWHFGNTHFVGKEQHV